MRNHSIHYDEVPLKKFHCIDATITRAQVSQAVDRGLPLVDLQPQISGECLWIKAKGATHVAIAVIQSQILFVTSWFTSFSGLGTDKLLLPAAALGQATH